MAIASYFCFVGNAFCPDETVIPADTLPTGYIAGVGNSSYDVNGNVGTLNAYGPATTGSWQSFNIGGAAEFNAFLHGGVHLSTVRDQSPSQIFGA